MKNILENIIRLIGIKSYLVAFLFGGIVSLALPPIYLFPFAILGFSAFLIQINNAPSKKNAFWLGWWFGWGHFTTGLYWISFALLTDVENFGWMIPFAMFGIPAVLAIYTGLVALLTYIVPRQGWQKVVLFAVLWTVIEMLRGVLFTGFPWNLTGYIWSFSDSMLQITSVTGIFGLSFFTVLAFAMPAIIKNKRSLIFACAAFTPLIIIFIFGVFRLHNNETEFTDTKVRLVQGNISQNQKWNEGLKHRILQKYIDMSYSKGWRDIDHIIWPESAIPFFIEEDSPLLSIIRPIIPKGGTLITGSIHAKFSKFGYVDKMWNSMHVIDSNGDIAAIYNKSHLVPFGEYVPFRSILPIEKITHGIGDFQKGDGKKTLSIKNLPDFSPLICYEAIFPNAVVDKSNYPKLMVNVTNDAWYGVSSGPFQHFEMVRARAIEQGIPMIRAANTGISAIIDSYGRIANKTTLNSSVILDGFIPSTAHNSTIYSNFGNIIILLIISIFSVFFLFKRY